MEARAHLLDQVSGARLVGGEMLEWSDLGRGSSSGVVGDLLARMAGGSPLGSVLLVGPRAATLAEVLPDCASLDVLVRGMPDARELAVEAKLRQGVTVHCGTLDRFLPERTFDVVVVLDGPEGVQSPDGEPLSHLALLERAATLVGEQGTLVAQVENELGTQRLFGLDVASRRDDDAGWGWEAPGHVARPPYHGELRRALDRLGLGRGELYAVLPGADDPVFLATSACLDDRATGGAAAALGTRALADAQGHRPSLADPYDVARRLFESGELLALAPAWLVVARRTETTALPALLSVESGVRTDWRLVHAVEPVDGSLVWRASSPRGGAEMRDRSVVRRFVWEDLPSGNATLEALMRRACATHDVATVRSLVQRYRAWLGAQPAQQDDVRFFAVPSNVLVDGSELGVVDATWALSVPLPEEVLLVRGLRHFATRLLAAGSEHPWSPDVSPDGLTRTLAAMVSVIVDERTIERVARVEAEVDVVLHGGDEVAESRSYAGNLEAGRSQFVAQAGPSRGYREAVAASVRLAHELEARSKKVEWLEATLTTRDKRVDSLERNLTAVRGSLSFRIGQLFTWPGRAVVTLGRRIVSSVLPLDFIRKAETALRKLTER